MTELEYFRHIKPSNSFYLALIGSGVISRFSSKSFKYFPNPCDPTISPIFYPTQKCISESLIFTNDLTIKSTGFNFLAYSIARYDHLQVILFGESPIGDLRTQSRKNFRDGFFFTKLVEGSSSVVLKDLSDGAMRFSNF